MARVTPAVEEVDRLDAVLQQMPQGVIVVEAATGRVLMMNSEARRLARPPLAMGIAAEPAPIPPDALTEPGLPLIQPDNWPLTRALRHGHTTRNQEMQYLREDGTVGTVLVSAYPVFDGERLDSAVATFTDVSGRLRPETEHTGTARADLLSTMSHEIRTPLNAIIGYVQLLEMGVGGVGTDAQRSYLQRLRTSSDHLLNLVNEVLDLSKADSGSLALAECRGSADVAIDGAVSVVTPLGRSRGVSLEHPLYSADGDVYIGDEDRVRQVLVNLLSNAVKFTPAGGSVLIESGTVLDPRIDDRRTTMHAVHAVRAGRWATITVTDTGVGIPADRLDAVFEPFVQFGVSVEQQHAESSRKPDSPQLEQRGTGLGLTISRRLARAMGGDLTVRSIEGQGSAFTLWLPAAPAE